MWNNSPACPNCYPAGKPLPGLLDYYIDIIHFNIKLECVIYMKYDSEYKSQLFLDIYLFKPQSRRKIRRQWAGQPR